MGGTSTDVSLIENGRPSVSNDAVVHGYPLKLPMLDIHTVGAGGGSIAFIDAGGLLHVGPRSAAADPGPICYGRGNEDQPTVTDANVVLRVLNPTHLLDGRLPNRPGRRPRRPSNGSGRGSGSTRSRPRRASSAWSSPTWPRRSASSRSSAATIPATMSLLASAAPDRSMPRGWREALEMPRVVIPKYPGIMCALGLLLTDLRTNFSPYAAAASRRRAGGRDRGRAFAELERRADAWFAARGHLRAAIGRSSARSTCATAGRATSSPWSARRERSTTRRSPRCAPASSGCTGRHTAMSRRTSRSHVTTLRLEASGGCRRRALP